MGKLGDVETKPHPGASPLPADLEIRLGRIRSKVGTAKDTAEALGCSASTYARASAGLPVRPGTVALIRAALDKIEGGAAAEEQGT